MVESPARPRLLIIRPHMATERERKKEVGEENGKIDRSRQNACTIRVEQSERQTKRLYPSAEQVCFPFFVEPIIQSSIKLRFRKNTKN